mmetsp:Transcript_25020/g.38693  ORF Transcript_25020/g.38693 Transcript_25020/m.38693 type:complete len:295 (+) Transcript_25020:28-912(+)
MTLALRLSSFVGLLTLALHTSGFVHHASSFGCEMGSTSLLRSRVATALDARMRRRKARDDYDEDDYYVDDDDDYYDEVDDLGYGRRGEGLKVPSPFGRKTGLRLPEAVSKAVLAGVFVLGIGTGVTVDSAINTNPKDLASRDGVDRLAPNPTLCTSYGASAMAFDQRVFVSFDPFNVYVAQADVKPACVLRPNNVVPILQGRGLLNDKDVRACKNNMNTWAFVGDLGDKPQLSCVYQSEDAQNEFLSNPKIGIGEDVYDDEREREAKASTRKSVKDKMTSAQAAKEVMNKGSSL